MVPDIQKVIPGKEWLRTMGSYLPVKQPEGPNIFQIRVIGMENRPAKVGDMECASFSASGNIRCLNPEANGPKHIFADSHFDHRISFVGESLRVIIE
jgi:hypothetical protein